MIEVVEANLRVDRAGHGGLFHVLKAQLGSVILGQEMYLYYKAAIAFFLPEEADA